MTKRQTLGDRIRQWDEGIESDEDARQPYDAGIMLVVADVLDAYSAVLRVEDGAGQKLADAMNEMRETAVLVIARNEQDERHLFKVVSG